MATRLFFRAFNNAVSGTFPSGEQSALTADYTATGGATLKRMATVAGSAMTSNDATSTASVLPQSGLYGMFVTNRFGEDQDIANQALTLNIAMLESDGNMNMGVGLTANVYVWRPSTGALIGTICANLALTGTAEPTAGSVRVVQGATSVSTPVSAKFADVIICEVWQTHTQGSAAAYIGGFYYEGGTISTTNDTLVSDHASFLNFAFDNLQLEVGFMDATFDVTLGALTLTASASTSTSATAADLTSTTTAAVTWGGASRIAANLASTATASLAWAGASLVSAAVSSAAVASLTWNGALIADSAWSAVPTALLSWVGQSNGAAVIASGAWSATPATTLTFTSSSIAAASFGAAAVSRVRWKSPIVKARNLYGSTHKPGMDEEDIPMIMSLVISYMESQL